MAGKHQGARKLLLVTRHLAHLWGSTWGGHKAHRQGLACSECPAGMQLQGAQCTCCGQAGTTRPGRHLPLQAAWPWRRWGPAEQGMGSMMSSWAGMQLGSLTRTQLQVGMAASHLPVVVPPRWSTPPTPPC